MKDISIKNNISGRIAGTFLLFVYMQVGEKFIPSFYSSDVLKLQEHVLGFNIIFCSTMYITLTYCKTGNFREQEIFREIREIREYFLHANIT